MKNYKKGIAAALIVALLFSCLGCGRKAKKEEKAVRAVTRDFAAAVCKGDMKKLSGLIDKDAKTESLYSLISIFPVEASELAKQNIYGYKIMEIRMEDGFAEAEIRFKHRDTSDIEKWYFLQKIEKEYAENNKDVAKYIEKKRKGLNPEKKKKTKTVITCKLTQNEEGNWKITNTSGALYTVILGSSPTAAEKMSDEFFEKFDGKLKK